jgi:1,4-alpha-glucan branching enzyme
MNSDRGALALVLHSHMPYVEGFGTWPFGEEWLWEAVASVYLPLLSVLEAAGEGGAAITVGLTPVLCDQLEAMRDGAAGERFLAYLAGIKEEIHAADAVGLEEGGRSAEAAELRRAARDYVSAGEEWRRRGGDLLAAFGALEHTALWTSSATHAILPLLATASGLRLQLETGVAGHTRRFGGFDGGLWLPECAYEPGLEQALAAAGVRCFGVEQTEALGLGSLDHLSPVATPAGPVAVPIDWATVELVWQGPSPYPSADAYRDHHRRTTFDLRPWSIDGRPYDFDRAAAQARAHAEHFVDHVIRRLDAHRAERGRPGLVCCALDTELLGHWWYEGPIWLAAVLEEAGARGLALSSLPAGLEQVEAVERPLTASTWGRDGDLSTWDAPPVAELVWGARRAELDVLAAASRPHGPSALARATRELLGAQASDWPFLLTQDRAGGYPLDRSRSHLLGLATALDAAEDGGSPQPEPFVRNLAPDLDPALLTAP